MKKLGLLLFWSVLAWSCLEDPNCVKQGDTALVISFRKLAENKLDTVVIYQITAEANGMQADSIFYSPGDEADTLRSQSAIIAVDPSATETSFTFFLPEGEQKTLQVSYQSNLIFISEDCGTDQLISNLRIVNTTFDSVRVVNGALSKNRNINIEIFN